MISNQSRLRSVCDALSIAQSIAWVTPSVDDIDAFWAAVWEFFDVQSDAPYERVLGSRDMPGAEWFPGASLSYAEHIFRGKDEETTAILHASELRELGSWTWGDLRRE